jgi:hypothetical protein
VILREAIEPRRGCQTERPQEVVPTCSSCTQFPNAGSSHHPVPRHHHQGQDPAHNTAPATTTVVQSRGEQEREGENERSGSEDESSEKED